MRSHRCEKAIAWSPCRSEDLRWGDESPLAGLCSCPRVTATCAQAPADWLRMTSVKFPGRLGMQARYCVALLTNRAWNRSSPRQFGASVIAAAHIAQFQYIVKCVVGVDSFTKTDSGLWFGTT